MGGGPISRKIALRNTKMLHGYVMKGDQDSVGRRTIDDLDRSARGEEEGNWERLVPKGDGQCEQIPVGRDCRGRSVRPSAQQGSKCHRA